MNSQNIRRVADFLMMNISPPYLWNVSLKRYEPKLPQFSFSAYQPLKAHLGVNTCIITQSLTLWNVWKQGVTQDLETGGQNWGFLKFRGSKVSYYTIYKNDHSNLIYWLSKTKCASLCHLMYLLSSRRETFEIFPWTQTDTENLAKYNWVSFSPKSYVLESKWLPGGCLGKSLYGSGTIQLVIMGTGIYI